jgi:hypothetical protein
MARRLAAVLIADVVGYGRLSQIDEEGTRARFQVDLKEVFEPKIAEHHGRLVKTMGDGLLVEFHSVVDALRCAVEVQREKADRKSVVPPETRLDFRIGVNLGDIIVEGEDIQGDGVNIADRLQVLAEPGGVAISGTVYDHVKAKLPVGYASLGEQRVKSIAERNEGEPTWLLAQAYFVFKNEADIERLLDGLSKAGVPELPTDVGLDPKDRLNGPEINSFAFGHELQGRKIAPEVEPYTRIASASGSITVTVGSTTTTGTTWVQGNFLCNAYPKALTTCGAIFRNPSGTLEQRNEYRSIYRWNRFEFSVVR